MCDSGVGNRFGDVVPKQYHLINGRPVIEYTIQASLKSQYCDEVIVVAREDYVDKLSEKYGVIAIEGGQDRNKSFKNALDYINLNYNCNKLVVIDAVNPLVTFGILDRFFEYLDEYDVVLTASHIPTSLGCYDIHQVDRERYYMIQNPHGYKFDLLIKYFDENSKLTVIAQQLPENVKTKLYWGFKDYAKIIYPHDIAVVEALLNERDKNRKFESHKNDISLQMFQRLRKIWSVQVKKWEKQVDSDIAIIFEKWHIKEYVLNPESNFGLVFECKSEIYDDVVVKIIPPFVGRYKRELEAVIKMQGEHMVRLIAYDEECSALLLERITPGDYVNPDRDIAEIEILYKDILLKENFEIEERIICESHIPDFMDELYEKYCMAKSMSVFSMECEKYYKLAKQLYNVFGKKRFLIHGDISCKNALLAERNIKLIDPLGYYAPIEFEGARMISYYCLENMISIKNMFEEKIHEYILEKNKLKNAVIIDIISMFFGAIIWRNDNYERANQWRNILEEYLRGEI